MIPATRARTRTSRRAVWLAVLAGCALLGAGIWFYLAPHRAATELFGAAKANDPVRLSSYVDFPSVKESLKFGLKQKMAPADKGEPGFFQLFGAAVAASIADPIIDAMLTPRFIVLLMTGRRITAAELAATPDDLREDVPEPDLLTHYRSFDEFVLTVKPQHPDDSPTRLIFERHGWLSWRLAMVKFGE